MTADNSQQAIFVLFYEQGIQIILIGQKAQFLNNLNIIQNIWLTVKMTIRHSHLLELCWFKQLENNLQNDVKTRT